MVSRKIVGTEGLGPAALAMVGITPRGLPDCQFFDVEPSAPQLVSQRRHDADADYRFFVPISGGGAVRVRVCREHLTLLEERYAEAEAAS